ncbi:MAG TPA: ribonuclease III [Candidatus Paceibacterota bacterium]|nr:ribonuclease III [Candidatus Paceibacterota bacterium]
MTDFSQLEEQLEIKFHNLDLLKQAFTHRSYLNENSHWRLGHNERLEFLGDAVLELVVSEYLFEEFPNEPEGYLTSLRASLVNADTLAKTSTELGFNDFILLSKGEAKDTGRGRNYILANTFEAFIGALYLDQDYKKAKKFIDKHLIKTKLTAIIEEKRFKDPKSLFQERAQAAVGLTPVYKVVEEWGPDHDKHFKMAVYLADELVAEGEGPSKQAAEINAAKNGLETKGW